VKTAPALDLPIRLDRAEVLPLERQLVEQLRQFILDGRLAANTRLPSTRVLALALGVSRNVAVAAYDELFAEGYVEGRHGSGTYIAPDLVPLARPRAIANAGRPRWLRGRHDDASPEPCVPPGAIDFRLGRPSVAPLDPQAWRRAWNDVAHNPPKTAYGPPAGDPILRAAIAGYLGRARGVACRTDDVVVTSGAVQALDLVARATLMPGDAVGFEEPGYPTARRVLLTHGADLLPLPVDDDGAQIERLPQGRFAPLLVYLTPSHQYPLGTRLSVTRRLAALEWARANDSLIVEDDYDSEFRFDAPPLPSLAGLDESGHVAYIGTFSKVLAPALRVGYLVAPEPLRERVIQLKLLADYHTPGPVQQALAAFLTSGHLEQHIRRMRRHYAEKRRVLHDALLPAAAQARLWGLDAGLHAYLDLRPGLDPDAVIACAAQHGVIVSGLDDYYIGAVKRHGVLLGYGGLTVDEIARGATTLAEIIVALGERVTRQSMSSLVVPPGRRDPELRA
jgi:GntR family transcriptional regulator/MocR family aminotransferase